MIVAALTHQDSARVGLMITTLVMSAIALIMSLVMSGAFYINHSGGPNHTNIDLETLTRVVIICIIIVLIGLVTTIGGLTFAYHLMRQFH